MAKHLLMRPTDSNDLADPKWWRNVLERVGRQDAQIVIALFGVTGVTADSFDYGGALVTILGASLLTIAKIVVGVTAKPDAPTWVKLLDRSGSAAAGVLAGALASNTPVWDILRFSWASVGWTMLTSAVVAALMFVVMPPSQASGTAEAQNSQADGS